VKNNTDEEVRLTHVKGECRCRLEFRKPHNVAAAMAVQLECE